jgi:hypothetical protein
MASLPLGPGMVYMRLDAQARAADATRSGWRWRSGARDADPARSPAWWPASPSPRLERRGWLAPRPAARFEPYGHEPTILPAQRLLRQEYPQVSKLRPVLERYTQ